MPIYHESPYTLTTNSSEPLLYSSMLWRWVALPLSVALLLALWRLSRDPQQPNEVRSRDESEAPYGSRHAPHPFMKGPQLRHGSPSVTSRRQTLRRT
jgi:hypothetical protein